MRGSKRKGRASKKVSPCSNRSSWSTMSRALKDTFYAVTRSLHVPAPTRRLSPFSDCFTFTHPFSLVAKQTNFLSTLIPSSQSPSSLFFISLPLLSSTYIRARACTCHARTHTHTRTHPRTYAHHSPPDTYHPPFNREQFKRAGIILARTRI